MPASWTWVWMLMAVMNRTLGQFVNDASPENNIVPELRSPKAEQNNCKKCHLLYPKKEYSVGSEKSNGNNAHHNVVFLVEDRKTGRMVKVAFMNGIKNKKGKRILKPWFKSKDPCNKLTERCVYRLISLKTGRLFKIDFKKRRKNEKELQVVKLAP